jgi:hypothetical protein
VNENEPLMRRRKRSNGIKTEGESLTRDKSGGNLFTAQTVPGVKAARAWQRHLYGTWKPIVLTLQSTGVTDKASAEWSTQAADCEREKLKQQICKSESTGARRRDGASHMSEEVW